MNRRSFLKIAGAGAGSLATFSLVPATMREIHKFAGKQSIDKVQAEMQAMDKIPMGEYERSTMVKRVPTRKTERALLLGLEHHLGKDFEVVQIDHYIGRAYFPIELHHRKRTIPVTFKFIEPGPSVCEDFEYMISYTKDIADTIKLYPMHLEADPAFKELAWRTNGNFVEYKHW